MAVPANLVEKMSDYNMGVTAEQQLRTISVYLQEETKKFVPVPIAISELTEVEKSVYNKINSILSLIGGRPYNVKSIQIVEKIYDSDLFRGRAVGLWQKKEGTILIKRTQLQSIKSFAATLLHECAHAVSGADDASWPFEIQLSDYLGIIAEKAIKEIEKMQ